MDLQLELYLILLAGCSGFGYMIFRGYAKPKKEGRRRPRRGYTA